ncbi:MAG: DUF4124 domain-containing protein [Gammaproteobacteria bacterium]|jgi:hypothetical protein
MRFQWLYLLLVVAGSAAGAQIYRSVDADGNVTYSDRPAGDDVESIFIDTATATLVAANAADNEATEAGATAAEDEADEVVYAGPTAEEIAAERMENCGLARDREERYLAAHRIYMGSEAEREYLSDAELDGIRLQATADVEEWCD